MERRRHARTRTLHAGKIVYGDYRYVIDCVLRNVSEEGARLKVQHVPEVPDSFELFDATAHRLTPAEVIWRSDREIGVHFIGAPVDLHSSRDPRHARFKYL